MKRLFLLSIIIISLVLSCRKDNIQPEDNSLTPVMARDSLYDIMTEWYYWYDLIPTVKKEDYNNPYDMLEAMRYKTLDRWSFVADYEEFNDQMQGEFVGHGFRIGVDNEGNARIAMIYDRSPLYLEGVRRSWIVKTINEVEVAPILLANDNVAYTNLIGPGTAGITNTFIFQNPLGEEVTIRSTKAEFQINSVLLYDTLHLSSGIAGHLVFESFIKPSQAELATAFAFFSTNNVSDIILDLRYNSGGYLYVAQTLASYIAGNSHTGTIFAELEYNSLHQDANNPISFITTPYPLNLPRLIVITTRSTASASEAIMNGLNPFIDVVSIGDTTNGKPTGMNGWNVGDKYYIWPITFKMVNKDKEGDYFEGLFPDKVMSDDITHDFSDREESCLKEAIFYLENGSVSGKSGSEFTRNPQFSDKPEWMNNAFVIEK